MRTVINKNFKEKKEEFSRFVNEKSPMSDDFKQNHHSLGKNITSV